MKKIIAILSLVSMLFIGCSDDDDSYALASSLSRKKNVSSSSSADSLEDDDWDDDDDDIRYSSSELDSLNYSTIDVKVDDDLLKNIQIKDTVLHIGKSYLPAVQYGLYIWLVENEIDSLKNNSMCYGNESSNCESFGMLYANANFSCPTGFRIPTENDWMYLEKLGGVDSKNLNFNFVYGGHCEGGKDSIDCSGKNKIGYYWTSDNKVFVYDKGTKKSSFLSLSYIQLVNYKQYYSGRCVKLNHYVNSMEELPICDNTMSDRFFVMSEFDTYYCSSGKWTSYGTTRCDSNDEGVVVKYGDTTYVCNYNWKKAQITDVEACDEKNENSVYSLNGVPYVCSKTGWRTLTAVEKDLGLCNRKLWGYIDTVFSESYVTDYVCDSTGWRRPTIFDYYGKCLPKRKMEVVSYSSTKYYCVDSSWIKVPYPENEIGFCNASTKGTIDTTTSSKIYYCDSTGWRSAVMTDYVGVCDSGRIDEVVLYGDTKYYCMGASWKTMSTLESDFGLCRKGNYAVKDTLSTGEVYVCDSTGWRKALISDLYGVCDSSKIDDVILYGGTKYYCTGISWKTMSTLESNFGLCRKSNYAVKDTLSTGEVYVCDNDGWRKVGVDDYAGKCTSEKLAQTYKYKDTVYVCRYDYEWTKLTEMEKNAGVCDKSLEGSLALYNAKTYICKDYGWSVATANEALGACNSSNAWTVNSYNGSQYVCKSGSWVVVSANEKKYGFCTPSNVDSVLKDGSKYMGCYSTGVWKEISKLDYDLKSICKDKYPKTLKNIGSYYYKCNSSGWVSATVSDVYGQCTSSSFKQQDKAVAVNGALYTCDTNKVSLKKLEWYRYTTFDSLGGYCTKSSVGNSMTYQDSSYICKATENENDYKYDWNKALPIEFLGSCTSSNEGRKKVFNSQSRVCKNGVWFADLPTFTDSRDNKKYRMVKIGKLTWMADNLDYANVDTSWCVNVSSQTYSKNAKCNNGRLYPDYVVAGFDSKSKFTDSFKISDIYNFRGICPEGWRMPTTIDWENLKSQARIDFHLSSADTAMSKKNPLGMLYAVNAWPAGVFAEDGYGMSIAPTGLRVHYYMNGRDERVEFKGVNVGAYYWSPDNYSGIDAFKRYWFGQSIGLDAGAYNNKLEWSYAVRCVQ